MCDGLAHRSVTEIPPEPAASILGPGRAVALENKLTRSKLV
jgi:hypothetical protein